MTHLPPTELILTLRREQATLIVYVSGELDYDTCSELTDTVTTALAAHKQCPVSVRLDFRGLACIDSSGLSALLMIHRHTSHLGATLHLDNPPPSMQRLLRITNVWDHLTSRPAGPDERPGDGSPPEQASSS